MLSKKLRERLTYKNLFIAVLLVFALPGVAFAGTQAKKILITSTKQISPSVLKKLKGADGAPGAQGPVGLTGPAGAAGVGSVGKEGVKGEKGDKGETGKEGRPGETGFTETLPKGKTETGTWAFGATSAEGLARIPISFSIPLKAKAIPATEPALSASQVHFVGHGELAPAGCGSGTDTIPEAEPGNLCVYAFILVGAIVPFEVEFTDPGSFTSGAGAGGTIMALNVHAGAVGIGDWAVTAP
jgi:hypothetical protein